MRYTGAMERSLWQSLGILITGVVIGYGIFLFATQENVFAGSYSCRAPKEVCTHPDCEKERDCTSGNCPHHV